MSRLSRILVVAVGALAVLACSLVRPPATQSGSLGSVADLWDDVPRMDGLAALDEDLPLFAQVLLRAVLQNVAGGGEAAGNWIVFTTDEPPEAVPAFYTEERMAEHGWRGNGQHTCSTGEQQGVEQMGVTCFFQKQVGDRWNALLLATIANERSGGYYVVFIKIDVEATPEPPRP